MKCYTGIFSFVRGICATVYVIIYFSFCQNILLRLVTLGYIRFWMPTFLINCYSLAEEERIRKCKGRIFALRDEPEVARVWLPHNDTPGLAMARAFGDFCLKDFGLISVPDISYRRISDQDEFVLLATDGVTMQKNLIYHQLPLISLV